MTTDFYSGNDKAIEFEATKNDARRMIRNLEKIQVSATESSLAIDRIENEVKTSLSSNNIDVFEGNFSEAALKSGTTVFYEAGISGLNKVIKYLRENYGVYFKVSSEMQRIKRSLEQRDEITAEEADSLGFVVVDLLSQIHFSETIYYEDEKYVVETIFSLAYQVIKAELMTMGKSKILEWAKINPVAGSYISDCVEQDLNSLKDEEKKSPMLQTFLEALYGKEDLCSYLDDGLIMFLAVQKDGTKLRGIEERLLNLYKAIESQTREINAAEKNLNLEKENVSKKEQYAKRRRGFVLKEAGLIFVAASVLAGLLYGSVKIGDKIFPRIRKYKTESTIYSTHQIVQTPAPEEEYMEALPDFQSTTAYKYEPWSIGFMFGRRNIFTYDMNSYYGNSDEEYITLAKSLDGVWVKEESRKKESLNQYNDIYDEAIYEVVHLVQDKDVYHDERDESSITFQVVAYVIFCALYCIFNTTEVLEKLNKRRPFHQFLWDDINALAKDIKKLFSEEKEVQKEKKKLLEFLEVFKKLGNENAQFRSEFLNLYMQYKDLIGADKIHECYQKLTREKKETSH